MDTKEKKLVCLSQFKEQKSLKDRKVQGQINGVAHEINICPECACKYWLIVGVDLTVDGWVRCAECGYDFAPSDYDDEPPSG